MDRAIGGLGLSRVESRAEHDRTGARDEAERLYYQSALFRAVRAFSPRTDPRLGRGKCQVSGMYWGGDPGDVPAPREELLGDDVSASAHFPFPRGATEKEDR